MCVWPDVRVHLCLSHWIHWCITHDFLISKCHCIIRRRNVCTLQYTLYVWGRRLITGLEDDNRMNRNMCFPISCPWTGSITVWTPAHHHNCVKHQDGKFSLIKSKLESKLFQAGVPFLRGRVLWMPPVFQGAEWRATSESGGITGITSKGCNQLQQTPLELSTDSCDLSLKGS